MSQNKTLEALNRYNVAAVERDWAMKDTIHCMEIQILETQTIIKAAMDFRSHATSKADSALSAGSIGSVGLQN